MALKCRLEGCEREAWPGGVLPDLCLTHNINAVLPLTEVAGRLIRVPTLPDRAERRREARR